MIQNLNKKHTGFTLVELLVVIAIIGLLSTIVLVSFGPVRNQARDTAIKANLSQMRLAAEIAYANNGTYTGANTGTDFNAAKTAITAAGGAVTELFNATNFCINSTLLFDSAATWCIDSTGHIGNSPGGCTAQICQ